MHVVDKISSIIIIITTIQIKIFADYTIFTCEKQNNNKNIVMPTFNVIDSPFK